MAGKLQLWLNDTTGRTQTDLNYNLVTDNKHLTMNNMVDYLGRIASGNTKASVRVDNVPATAVITCASVLEADTVTVNGKVLTAQDGREKFTVLCVADSSGSLNDTYFTFSSTTTDYYVWYNVNSAGTDPEIEGKTGVEVALATDAADTAVASATNTAIDALTGVSSTVSTATVTVVIDAIGNVTNAAQGAVTTGFTITVTRAGASTAAAEKFLMNTSDTATAASLAAAFQASAEALVYDHVQGTSDAAVVTVQARIPGPAGNAVTIETSDGTRLAITGGLSRLASGAGTTFSFGA